VGNVGITQKSSVRLMGCVPREKKSPTIKKRIFLGDPQEGGGNSPWRAHHLGERKEWRGINEGRGVERHWDEAKR
jgi:hypothetical protein